ncbi:MAG: MFS transporter [Bacilli bacterium]|jgi:YNFM family putative membrane transporter|uniref:MFS transporter n=1 Tax=Ureibacillus sp. FSL W7-1570 TaxID=2954593 RepID=UPI001ED24C1F|nr:MFS transporter [Bacilli bacterium]
METKGYQLNEAGYWRIVASLGLASTFIFASFYSFQPLIPVFEKEFSISVTYSSLTMSLATLSLIFGLIVLGFFSDRNGRVVFIKLSVLLSILPFLVMLFVEKYWVISLLRFIQGFTLAGVPAASLAYIGEEIESKVRNLATSIYISTNALGGMIGRFLAGNLSETYSWQSAITIIMIFGICVFIFVLIALPKSKFFVPSAVSFLEDLKGFGYHLNNPILLLLFGLGIVLQITFTGTWTYLPFQLAQPPFSMSLDSISFLYFAYAFGIIGAPIASWLSNKFTLEKVRTFAIFFLSFGVLCTLHSSLFVVLFGLCVVCFGFFTAHSLTAASVGKTATHLKGSASSLYLVAYYIGVASGSTLVAPVYHHLGWKGFILITVAVTISYVIFLNFSLIKYHQKKSLEN